MNDDATDATGSGGGGAALSPAMRWAIAVAVVLALTAAGGAWVYFSMFVPRRASLVAAIDANDLADVARFMRSNPALLDDPDFVARAAAAAAGAPGSTPPGLPGAMSPSLPPGSLSYAVLQPSSTPLTYAIAADRPEVAGLLLRLGADVNLQWRGGLSAIETALKAPDAEARCRWIDLLIDGGLDANAPNSAGLTPLVMLLYAGDLETAGRLVERGAAIDAPVSDTDADGSPLRYTALHWAVAQRLPTPTVDWLLERGADPDAPCRVALGDRVVEAGGAAELAWRIRAYDMAGRIVERGGRLDPAARSRRGRTPLHSAITNRDGFLVRTLLEAGADPRAADESGRTPLDLARTIADSYIRQLVTDAAARSSAAGAPDTPAQPDDDDPDPTEPPP